MGGLGRSQEPGLANRHPVGERPVAGARGELGPGGEDHPVGLGDRCQGLLEGPLRRPPELVRVVVDHPVGAHLGRDARDPLLAALPLHVVDAALHALEVNEPRRLVALEDLEGPVRRAGVGDDEEVDALRAMEAQVVLDDVRLVANLVDHPEPHGSARLTGSRRRFSPVR